MDDELKKRFSFVKNGIELEARFGIKNKISRNDFDNVVAKLKSLDFQPDILNGHYYLNIMNEYINKKTNRPQISNIRTQINHIQNVKKYCLENTIPKEIPQYIFFTQKKTDLLCRRTCFTFGLFRF